MGQSESLRNSVSKWTKYFRLSVDCHSLFLKIITNSDVFPVVHKILVLLLDLIKLQILFELRHPNVFTT